MFTPSGLDFPDDYPLPLREIIRGVYVVDPLSSVAESVPWLSDQQCNAHFDAKIPSWDAEAAKCAL